MQAVLILASALLGVPIAPLYASAVPDLPVPKPGTTLTYSVNVEGRTPSALVLWSRPGKSTETLTYKGEIGLVEAKMKDGKLLAKKGPCIWIHTENKEVKEATADHYYVIDKDGLRFFYRKNATGEFKAYPSLPMWMPAQITPGFQEKRDGGYAIYVRDSGVPILRTYLSPDGERDRAVITTFVREPKTITTPAGSWKAFPVTNLFEVTTGGGLRRVQTRTETTQWYSPDLRAIIQEISSVHMTSGFLSFDSKIEKTLVHPPALNP
jgi:hypothetical protein